MIFMYLVFTLSLITTRRHHMHSRGSHSINRGHRNSLICAYVSLPNNYHSLCTSRAILILTEPIEASIEVLKSQLLESKQARYRSS
jgi:hypothetical protein